MTSRPACRFPAFCLAGFALLSASPGAARAGFIYDFTLVATTPGGSSAPSLNDRGDVAFGTPSSGPVLRVRAGGEVTVIDPMAGGASTAINNQGTVALITSSGSGTLQVTSISTGSGGPVTVIASGTPIMGGTVSSPSINDHGSVAFVRNQGANMPPMPGGVYVSSGGAVIPITDINGPLNSFGDSALNNEGLVAFRANRDAGGSGVFTSSGGLLTTIADTGGPFSGFGPTVGSVSLNDAGVVAFIATLDAGGSGIFIGSGGPVTTVADTGGPFASFFAPSINNAGTVAFFATLDAGGSGIFTGPDPVADRVIGTGDALFGSTVTSPPFGSGLSFFREGLNDAGQVAFTAVLADGRRVVVRADPAGATPVPEPTALTLLGLGSLLLVGCRRRRAGVGGECRPGPRCQDISPDGGRPDRGVGRDCESVSGSTPGQVAAFER